MHVLIVLLSTSGLGIWCKTVGYNSFNNLYFLFFSQGRESTPRVLNNAKRIIDMKSALPPDVAAMGWFWNVIRASGLYPLLETNYGQVDHGLLIAFLERWHSETSSFHLPVGEMTITLDDVSCLLHILVGGNLLFHESLSIHQGTKYLVNYLGLEFDESAAKTKRLRSAYITYDTLLSIYTSYLTEAKSYVNQPGEEDSMEWYWTRCIRAFLLYLVGCTLFSDKADSSCCVVYLKYFDDLTMVNQWSWGAVALAFLYNYLGNFTKLSCMSLSGYTCLMQVKFYKLNCYVKFGRFSHIMFNDIIFIFVGMDI